MATGTHRKNQDGQIRAGVPWGEIVVFCILLACAVALVAGISWLGTPVYTS